MSVGLLLAEFERIGDVPDAVPRLRRFVVGLAVAGRLSDQHSNEDPTEALAAMKSASAASEVPPNWVCAPLGDLIELQYGKGLPAAEREERGPVAVYGSNGSVARTNEALVEHPAIIVGRKGSAGALVLAEGPSWTTDVAYYIVPPPYFEIHFLFLALQALHLETLGKGVKPGLSRSDANPLPLAVPPLPEQRRIVAKVDELMSLCDQLEAAQKERELQRDALRSVSLHRLTESEDEPANVRFFLDKSARLITKPEHVAEVQQTILGLAVRGRLTGRNPRRGPDQWETMRLKDLLVNLQTGPFGSSLHQADYVLGGTPVINPASIVEGRLLPISKMAIGPNTLERLATFKLKRNDVVMARRGEMGRCAVVSEHEEGWLCGTGSLVLRFPPSVFPHFAALLLGSPGVREYLRGSAVGSTMQNLNQSILLDLTVDLPPLAEQHRIVAKVDELMAVCHELETALDSAQHHRALLLESLLREALNRSSGGQIDIQDLVGLPALPCQGNDDIHGPRPHEVC